MNSIREITYANLSVRVKAAIIDSLLLIGFIIAISELFDLFEAVPDTLRMVAFIFAFILYDPLFTSIYGGTIGHSFSGIGVRSESDVEKKIPFPMALMRFLVKVLLGWISLVTITGNKKKKAIHDYVAKSVVVEEGEVATQR